VDGTVLSFAVGLVVGIVVALLLLAVAGARVGRD
jgi:xanthosine utilization system XapX-like protein